MSPSDGPEAPDGNASPPRRAAPLQEDDNEDGSGKNDLFASSRRMTQEAELAAAGTRGRRWIWVPAEHRRSERAKKIRQVYERLEKENTL